MHFKQKELELFSLTYERINNEYKQQLIILNQFMVSIPFFLYPLSYTTLTNYFILLSKEQINIIVKNNKIEKFLQITEVSVYQFFFFFNCYLIIIITIVITKI